jgi:L-cysteine desulfidase
MKTTNAKQTFILNLLDKLVTPAFGCTEIGCIAFATSIASENLKSPLAKATVYVSGFIYRNVINVGVPLIGKIGAKGIAAAGFIVKQSHKKLLILENVSKTQVNLIKKLADTNKIKVVVQKHCDPVYVKVIAKDTNGNRCDVLIERKHDTVKHIRLNNINLPTETYTKTKSTNLFQPKFDVNDISLTDIYLTIKKVKIKDLDFLQKGINMNEDVANFPTRKNKYFHPIHEKLS